MSTTPQEPLKDDDIETTGSIVRGRRPTPTAPTAATRDGTDGGDADGTDGGDADGTDGDATRRRDRRLSVSALELLSGDAQTFLEKVWASRVHVHQRRPRRPGRPALLRRRRPPADRDGDPHAGRARGPGRHGAARLGLHPRSATSPASR